MKGKIDFVPNLDLMKTKIVPNNELSIPSFAFHTLPPDLSSRGNLLQLLDDLQMGFTGGIR